MIMLLKTRQATKSFKEDRSGEKPVRSILKTISWRTIGTLDTIAISWVLTGKVETALAIGSVELVTKMILYFGHERLWNAINFGKE